MKLLEFDGYESYIETQRRTDSRKSSRSCVQQDEVKQIGVWVRGNCPPIKSGICHGARHGVEVNWFAEEFPDAAIIGTDLFSKGHPAVVQHDFHERVERWAGRYDFVYSNALDHAYDPEKALSRWFEQLSPTGVLLVQHSRWHVTVRGGDCFGAQFEEYIELLNKIGVVVADIPHYLSVRTIVCRNRPR